MQKEYDLQNAYKEIKIAIKQVAHQYKNISDDQILIQRMTGLTNQTYKVSSLQTSTQISSLIYRKFGQSTKNLFLDRDSQKYVYEHISQKGQGPKILAYIPGIRIQQFIPSTVLKTQQMLIPQYYQKVAFALRRFHQLPAEQLEKKSLFKSIFFQDKQKILSKCIQKMNQSQIFTPQQLKQVEQLRKWVTLDQIQFIQKIVQPLQKEGLIFSHNDLLANNVLFTQKEKNALFIDYEYSRFNYRIYDIGNYFTETQYDYDVTQQPFFGVIPITLQKQNHKSRFIQCYCTAGQINNYQQYLQKVKKNEFSQDCMKEVTKLKKQLPLGMMLCNVVWGFWAILVSKNPAINFDYIQFAMKRMKDYYNHKQTILKSKKQ